MAPSQSTRPTSKRNFKSPSPSKPHFKGKGRAVQAVYDDDARLEYLTGFSKRKKAKKEAAVVRAQEREKVDHREMRKQLRESRREKVSENIEEQAQFYGTDMFNHSTFQDENVVEEFKDDENTCTTVTIETLNVDHEELESKPQRQRRLTTTTATCTSKPKSSLSSFTSKNMSKVKSNKKVNSKIPYESKATRSIERVKKQRNRDSKKSGNKKK